MNEISSTPSPVRRDQAATLVRIRRIGAAVLAVAALGVLFGLAPRDAVTADDIAYVMAGDGVNQTSADSAPKQTVVNGWTARDLLELIAKQQVASSDPRPAALLTIGVLALCLGLATGGTRQSPVHDSQATARDLAPRPADLP